MIALPKAISQGSNAGGGGALTAFSAISAAKAEPDTIASAVANKTPFFMTTPITFQDQSGSGVPQGQAITDCSEKPITCRQSETPHRPSEAKKTSICRLF